MRTFRINTDRRRMRIHVAWYVLACCVLTGCSKTASMHVWKSSTLVGSKPARVALAPIVGDPEVAQRLEQAMLGNRTKATESIAMIDAKSLESISAVQLSSYAVDRSDIGSLSAARRADTQVLVEASIIRSDLTERQKVGRREPPPESMAVHWKLVDVATGTKIGENTILMDRKLAEKRFPDLEYTGGTGGDRVVTAIARESWGLLSPHFEKEEVQLANAWLTPGASSIRQGNTYAKQGRWDLAEQEWQTAVSLHPKSKAGWHNLSLAAAAREDFSLAKSRMKHAESWTHIVATEPSSVWIEQQQREYHSAFQLPPPKEGWTFPEPPKPVDASQIQSTAPKDIDAMPWWTAIPFTKPPGWTWKSWLLQPVAL